MSSLWGRKESRIAWSRASAEFDFFIEWGKYLEKGTFARDLFEGGKTEGDSPSPVRADLWLDSRRLNEGAEIYEQSIFLRNYRSVLSLLWIKEPISKQTTPRTCYRSSIPLAWTL
jgi:hypothetical protein